MNSWTFALDSKALKMGVLKLPDRFFTCPRCKRKVSLEESLSIRTARFCSRCAADEMASKSVSRENGWMAGRFRKFPAWQIQGLR